MILRSKLSTSLVSSSPVSLLAWAAAAPLLVLTTACGNGGGGAGGGNGGALDHGEAEQPSAERTGEQASALATDSLAAYADKCDLSIGATVPWFDCDDPASTEVPVTTLGIPVAPANASFPCDRPEQLHEDCDAHSRFRVLVDSPSVSIVAHCRKRFLTDSGVYGDIAVIQRNKQTGATCFYQALGSDLDGTDVRPPSEGQSAWRWKTPANTAAIGCVKCHDNGAIIRSPYLTQITAAGRALPGAGDVAFNKNQPYSFVGKDFATWKAYKVEVAGNLCNNCHRMGVSEFEEVNDVGTSRDFGIRATSEYNINKNFVSVFSPMWMLKDQHTYSSEQEADARIISACADHRADRPLPSSPSCRITLFTRGTEAAATGNPAAYARADGYNSVVHRDAATNHIYELYLDGGTWHQADLSGASPTAVGSPAAYRRADQVNAVVYRSANGHIQELFTNGVGWGIGDLTTETSAVAAVGNPSGYVRHDGINAVVYRSSDGHLRELTYNGVSGWQKWDLSASAGAVGAGQLAAGDPVGYVRSDGVSAVVYRGTDNHVRDLYLDANGWHAEDPWAASGSPAAALAIGDPTAYVRSDGVSAVVYRSTPDNHVRELTLTAVPVRPAGVILDVARVWTAVDLTAQTGAPAAAGRPAAYVRSDNINSIVYRDVGGHLRELTLNALNGGSWQAWDFYAQTGTAAAVGDPFGYLRSDMMDAVVFKSADGHTRELHNVAGSGWQLTILN